MGKRSRRRRTDEDKRQRREERKREAFRLPPSAGPGSRRASGTDSMRLDSALFGAVDARLRGDVDGAAARVMELARFDLHDVAKVAEDELRRALPKIWDSGWQPTELVRHARRVSSRAGRIVAAAVLADHQGRAAATLDPRWSSQVAELESVAGPLRSSSRWLLTIVGELGLDAGGALHVVVDALVACLGVGPITALIPPPGRATTSAARPAPTGPVDDGVLAKVRALLAQAESTTFEAEAATFTAKAQELMARHAIDKALLWEESGRDEAPVTIRLFVDDPYLDVKALLLQHVAEASRCRTVFHDRYAMSSVVGFADDVAAAEVLFTSLLVQSQVALQVEAARAPAGSRARSRSFRASFLMSFTQRIAERLAEVTTSVVGEAERTHGGSLLPALVAREERVDTAVEEEFGELRSSAVRRRTDFVGWERGRLAADRAKLGAADLDEPAATRSISV